MTPIQARMARAALNLSLRDLAPLLHVSAQALGRYEQTGAALGAASVQALETFYRSKRIYCGPHDSLLINQDVLAQERFMTIALVQLLHEAGIHPTSGDLLAAYERAPHPLEDRP